MTKEKIHKKATSTLANSKDTKEYDKTLASLMLGETAIVYSINSRCNAKRRFLDLGIISGTTIKALYKSPYGDPTAYLIRGTVIALRSEDSRQIFIL